MRKLKLPMIKETPKPPRTLSMDEYLKFVRFNLKHTFQKAAYRKWKKILAVNVPFVIK